ncbi:nucleoside triphosphate pyrophosphohydrolase [bacterium]|nr:nucleoside triphosphate pyrophosphohydrolase [bacterium]
MKKNLKEIVDRLRRECPWDRAQTMQSIRHLYVEEAYELSEALESADSLRISEELGDLLYIVLMGIRIAEDEGIASYEQVEEKAAEKLIRRHPHVFKSKSVSGEAEVLANWEKIKEDERLSKESDKGFFSGVPKLLPALIRAQMMQERAARVGFDWPTSRGPLDKIHEEAREIAEHLESDNKRELEAELGDLLFSVVNLARHIGVQAEEALSISNKKFSARFEHVRRLAKERNLSLEQLSIKELDELWEEAKKLPQEDS